MAYVRSIEIPTNVAKATHRQTHSSNWHLAYRFDSHIGVAPISEYATFRYGAWDCDGRQRHGWNDLAKNDLLRKNHSGGYVESRIAQALSSKVLIGNSSNRGSGVGRAVELASVLGL